MALIYGLPVQIVTPTTAIAQPKKKEKSKMPGWANLLISIGITIIASIVTEGIGGVAGVLIGGAVDTGGQVTNDVLSGYRDPLTLTTDILFSALPPISRASRISKIAENPIEQIATKVGKGALRDDLDNLAREMQKVENIEGMRPQDFAKNYLKTLAENNRLSTKYAIGNSELMVKTGNAASMEARVTVAKERQINRFLRKANRLLAFSDPAYAVKTVINKLTAPIKKRINAKINEVLGKATKFIGKSSIEARKAIMHSTLPLNHTVAPGIRGIRLISILNLPTAFHVEVVFDPILTKNKPPVMLGNKDFETFIEPGLNADSGGEYYLNNVAGGGGVGEFLRQNALFIGFSYVPGVAIGIDRVMIFHRAIDRVVRMSKKSYGEKGENVTKDIGYGATEGLVKGIKGMGMARAFLKTTQTGDKQFVIRYVGRKTKRTIKRRLRNKTNRKVLKYL